MCWRGTTSREKLRYGCHGCGWRSWAWEPEKGAADLEAHDCERIEPWIDRASAWRAALLEHDRRRAAQVPDEQGQPGAGPRRV